MIALLAVVAAFAHNGHIAYVRCCGAGTGIYVGRTLVYRAPHDDDPLTPAWSRDGTRIAFASGGIWTMRANGSGRTRLTSSGDEPTWSTDGKLAYEDAGWIRVTGSARRLAKGTTPAWAPDDSEILFVRDRNVWRMDTNGAHQHLLIRNAIVPAWSPGATKIAFFRGASLWIADRTGAHAHAVPSTSGIEHVAWSPDGRFFAYCLIDRGDLMVMRTDVTGAHPVTNEGGYFHAWPAWQRLP